MTGRRTDNFPHRPRPRQRRQASPLPALPQGGLLTTLTNLETIVNEALATPKPVRRSDRRELHLRGDTFDTMREFTNAVRALENAEEGTSLERTEVFAELEGRALI